MDGIAVIIKSSRRPWTLDRLLTSLRDNLINYEECEITVVDDRTEEKFISALKSRFPEVSFSNRAIWPEGQRLVRSLPYVVAWQTAVETCERKYILILEDDQWLTRKLDLRHCIDFMTRSKAWSLFLSSSSAELVDVNLWPTESDNFDHYLPRISADAEVSVRGIVKRLFVRLITSPNWFVKKLASLVLIMLSNYARKAWQSLAMINPMCGAIYQRQHWLRIWSGKFKYINENALISRILKDLRAARRPEEALAVSKQKFFATTFHSSISLTLGLEVDWSKFNKVWSEEWLLGNLQQAEGTEDWSSRHLAEILKRRLGENASSAYEEWVFKFGKLHAKH
jgi:hypothetical protein